MDLSVALAVPVRSSQKDMAMDLSRQNCQTSQLGNTFLLANLLLLIALCFFRILSIPSAFLAKPATQWEDDEDYALGSEIITGLKVCNDSAERGVKLLADFSHLGRAEKKTPKLHAGGRRGQKENS